MSSLFAGFHCIIDFSIGFVVDVLTNCHVCDVPCFT